MDLLPTPEQDEIVATVRSQLRSDFDLHTLAVADGTDVVVPADLWRRCAELGWFGLGLEESLGGVGFGLAEETLLFAELGAHATPGPFLATVLGARVAALAGRADVAAEVLAGDAPVALAEVESAGPDDRHLRITDLGGSRYVLVVDDDRVALLGSDSLDATSAESIDLLVPLATAPMPAEQTGVAELTGDDAAAIRRRGTVLVASTLAGIAVGTAEQSVAYARDREQFGVPIGSFQAVKHRCADMAVRAEAATSQVRLAALALADGRPDAAFQVEAARVVATGAAIDNAQTNVFNHGGIGFTWEHTAHRFVTRAQVLSRTLGNRRDHLALLLREPSPS
ncbi:MAG: acyl-CoA dehydrogenase family protein [Microthrixaceae bacterium]|jgi:alkylation response protein AidB-like acyl-CoA dehydrogenase